MSRLNLTIIVLFLFIIFLIITFLSYDKINLSNNSAKPFEIENDTSYEIGKYMVTINNTNLYLPGIIKSVTEKDGTVLANLELKNSKKKSISKIFVFYTPGKENTLFIKRVKKISDPTDYSLAQIKNTKDASKQLSKYVGHYIYLSIPLPASKDSGLPSQYIKYLPCNNNVLDFLENDSKIKNCEAFSGEFSVYDKNN